MPKCCFVPECKTGYASQKKIQNGTVNLSLFQAPKNIELRKKWEQSICRKDKLLQPTDSVCELHFEPHCILTEYKCIINGQDVFIPRDKKQLQTNAIPTIFPYLPAPAYLTRNVTKRKLLAERGKQKKKQLKDGLIPMIFKECQLHLSTYKNLRKKCPCESVINSKITKKKKYIKIANEAVRSRNKQKNANIQTDCISFASLELHNSDEKKFKNKSTLTKQLVSPLQKETDDIEVLQHDHGYYKLQSCSLKENLSGNKSKISGRRNAYKGLPEGICIEKSSNTNKYSVWTTIPFSKGILFGPYGDNIFHNESENDHKIVEVYHDGKFRHCFEGKKYCDSNWLKYVNHALNEKDHNMITFHQDELIYYQTSKQISAGTELLVWYNDYVEENEKCDEKTNSSCSFEVDFNEITIKKEDEMSWIEYL